jgi:hypothetical protein
MARASYKAYLHYKKLQDSEGAWRVYNEDVNEAYQAMKPAAQKRFLKDTFDRRFEKNVEVIKKRKIESERRYMQKNNVRQVMVKFNRSNEDENELFEYLFSQGNMQGYVKGLIRQDMEQNKNS